jgi:Lar family restriction alleviation protein
MTTAPDEAMLPCPFCGGEAKHYHRPDTTGWSNTDWVSCSDDDCGVSTAMEETKAEAIAAWNRRAGQAHAAGLLEALEFYADPEMWLPDKAAISPVYMDDGRVARAAIAAAKGA